MKKIAIIDNHDSFTGILGQYIERAGAKVLIVPENEADIEEVKSFDGVVFSPGPDIPQTGNVMEQILGSVGPRFPVLGICLGHQAIGKFFGAQLKHLDEVRHGQKRQIQVVDEKDLLFRGLPRHFDAGLYHSWVIEKERVPDNLIVTAMADTGNIMAIKHRKLPVWGVQFHPESYMTEVGLEVLGNWINLEP
ncbi:MAG: aminodeoxychorismate/anthranilate synthase component II [Cyclobacteriaceae bacterium]|nr:aminodeoxychorismate/anthranilate synthase component II [Cyclobacteriaceae bacterium]